MRETRRKSDFATSISVTEIGLIRIINDSFFHQAIMKDTLTRVIVLLINYDRSCQYVFITHYLAMFLAVLNSLVNYSLKTILQIYLIIYGVIFYYYLF